MSGPLARGARFAVVALCRGALLIARRRLAKWHIASVPEAIVGATAAAAPPPARRRMPGGGTAARSLAGPPASPGVRLGCRGGTSGRIMNRSAVRLPACPHRSSPQWSSPGVEGRSACAIRSGLGSTFIRNEGPECGLVQGSRRGDDAPTHPLSKLSCRFAAANAVACNGLVTPGSFACAEFVRRTSNRRSTMVQSPMVAPRVRQPDPRGGASTIPPSASGRRGPCCCRCASKCWAPSTAW